MSLCSMNYCTLNDSFFFVYRYAGPDSQRINDGFSVGFETYMSTNRHVIHASIDGRGSSSKGTAMMYAVYRKLGSAEMEDQITVTRSADQ